MLCVCFFFIFQFGMYLIFNILWKSTVSGLVTQTVDFSSLKQKCVKEWFIAEQIFEVRDVVLARDGKV